MLALIGLGLGLAGLTAWAFTQREHTLLRIYGPMALVRWVAESQRSKLTQYLEREGDGRPFPLVKRNWVYRAAHGVPTTTGFGTHKDLHIAGTHTLRPAPFGINPSEMPNTSYQVDVGRGGRLFRVLFPMNRSGGSFGAFGAHWTRAASDGGAILNRHLMGYPFPDKMPSGFLDNTGEGGLSPHHLACSLENQEYLDRLNERTRARGFDWRFRFDRTATTGGGIAAVPLTLGVGGEMVDGRYVPVIPDGNEGWAPGASEAPRKLIVQIGPSLSGFRTPEGGLDWNWLDYVCSLPDVAGVEIKGQQGAKPNDAGVVKKEKLTAELRALRGFAADEDYVSPARLPFIRGDVPVADQVADLIAVFDRLQALPNVARRGLITGYKMTYCGTEFIEALASHLKDDHGPDYLVVDGAEGGTGAGDPTSTDHVGVHTYQGISRTHQELTRLGVRDQIALVASGRVIDGADVAKLLCLGADYCNGIRGFMMATGCIQAAECHNNKCPTGITTHSAWRLRGFDPRLKCVRFANYGEAVRGSLMKLARITGVRLDRGEKFGLHHLDVVTGVGQLTRGDEVYRQPTSSPTSKRSE